MFERFTASARRSVVLAQEEARELRSEEISCAHLLLGLACYPSSQAARVLGEAGLGVKRLREQARRGLEPTALDEDALTDLGIDVDEVRTRVEATFGEGALDVPPKCWRGGHIRFDKSAKKALECALREAVHRKDPSIEDLHVLLGIIRAAPSTLASVFGLDTEALRAAAHGALDDEAA